MSNFFKGLKTVAQIASKYKKLAKQYHPDAVGGDGETMKVISAERDKALRRVLSKDGKSGEEIEEKIMDIIAGMEKEGFGTFVDRIAGNLQQKYIEQHGDKEPTLGEAIAFAFQNLLGNGLGESKKPVTIDKAQDNQQHDQQDQRDPEELSE